MWQAGHQVESFGLGGSGFGKNLAGKGRHGDAVAGIAAGRQGIGRRPGKAGHAVHGDGQYEPMAVIKN